MSRSKHHQQLTVKISKLKIATIEMTRISAYSTANSMPRPLVRGNPSSKEIQTVQNQPHKWKTSLCSCCEKPGGCSLCCKALCCPCCVYAENVSRLGPKEAICGGNYFEPCCGKFQQQINHALSSFDLLPSPSVRLPRVGALYSIYCLLRSTNTSCYPTAI